MTRSVTRSRLASPVRASWSRPSQSRLSGPAVANGTLFHASRSAADVKVAFMASAELRVLVVDSTKFRRRAVHRIAPLRDFDVVVTDDRVRDDELDELRAGGAEVVVAAVDEPADAEVGRP